jgi:hypothetical protein
VQLAQAQWGGPSAENLLILSLVTSLSEQATLEDEVRQRAADLPEPPPTPEVDDAAFRELQAAVQQAKADHAAAQSRVLGYAGAISGTPRATAGGPAALLDARDQAQEEARKAKARYDELVQMEQRARVALGNARQTASEAALREYRKELAGQLRQLDAQLAEVLLVKLLPEMLALRVRLAEVSLG